MADPIVGTDSANGTIKEDVGRGINKDPALGRTYTRTFQNTVTHYFSNTADRTGLTSYVSPAGAGQQPVGTYFSLDNGWYILPYNYVGSSIKPREWDKLDATASELMLLSMEFDIKHMSVLQENYTSRAGSTVLENVFETQPLVQEWRDTEYLFEDVLTSTPQPINNDAATGEKPLAFGTVNNDMRIAEPNSQAAGLLGRAYHVWPSMSSIYQLPVPPVVPPEFEQQYDSTAFSSFDNYDIHFHGANERWGHKWTNPRPVPFRKTWAPTSRWQTVYIGGAGANLLGTTGPGWYHNRLQACNVPWNYIAAKMNNWDTYANAFDGSGHDQSGSDLALMDARPPWQYLNLNLVQGPNGPLNFIAYMIVTYSCTLRIKEQMFGNNYTRQQVYGGANPAGADTNTFQAWDVSDSRTKYSNEGGNMAFAGPLGGPPAGRGQPHRYIRPQQP